MIRTSYIVLFIITLSSIFLIDFALAGDEDIDPSDYCWGTAACFTGEVTKVIDGDTIKVNGESIRFTLSSTPEISEYGGEDAKNYVESVCPVGTFVVIDEDDYQTEGSYGRMVGVIWCYESNNDTFFNLNEDVLIAGHAEISTFFCSKSEFEYSDWAQEYGCGESINASDTMENPEDSLTPTLSAIAISPWEIRLSWIPPTSTFKQSITDYIVEREISGGVYEEVGRTGGSTTFTASGLQTEKTYTYVVKAIFSAGGSPRSNTASATTLSNETSTNLTIPDPEYLENGCPVDLPYIWSNDVCRSYPEPFGIAAFVDPTKDPQYYVDRYFNDPSYKEWFDENYSEYDSIYQAVGVDTSAQPAKEPESEPEPEEDPEPVTMGFYENQRYEFSFEAPTDWRYQEGITLEDATYEVLFYPYDFSLEGADEDDLSYLDLGPAMQGLGMQVESPLIAVNFENIPTSEISTLNESTVKEYVLDKIRIDVPDAKIAESYSTSHDWGWEVSTIYFYDVDLGFGSGMPYIGQDITFVFKDRESYQLEYAAHENYYDYYRPVFDHVIDTMVIKGVVVPEFQEIALLVLASSIIMIVVVSRRVNFSIIKSPQI